jgi:hypothetical protein
MTDPPESRQTFRQENQTKWKKTRPPVEGEKGDRVKTCARQRG